MAEDTDIDAAVAKARRLAKQLNEVLDTLSTIGVDCISVIGPPSGHTRISSIGECWPVTRVSLVLNFKPVCREGEEASREIRKAKED